MVIANVIVADNDPLPSTGGSVLGNDTLNGTLVTIANTDVTPATNGPLTIDADGVVTVAPNTPTGTYTITYTICETGANPTNCTTAIATVFVPVAVVIAEDDENDGTPVNGSTGGIAIPNVYTNDTINGTPIIVNGPGTNVIVTTTSPIPTGILFNQNTGQVTVATGTPAGTYTFTYQICESLNPTNCEEATVTVTVNTINEIDIYSQMTPNGDGLNDSFVIDGITNFPVNTVEVYNRWGVLVYETKGYNNTTNSFTGVSNGRVTISKGDNLPEGTYYYVVIYTKPTGETKEKAGYLYITR